MTQNALPGPPAPVDTQEEQERSQQPSQNPLQEVHGAWMERAWRMGVTASSFFCLCLLSQITAMWVLYMLNGYGAFPAAHKVLDLMQYLLSPLEYNSVEEEMSWALQRDLWRMETLRPLLVTIFLGFVILAIGILYCLKMLTPVGCPPFLDDRRQSVSRQPSFTYSEWTDAKQDLFDMDSVPETPVFDCSMDLRTEADPTTLTVKSVGLQERRGSNVSLTLDMCAPGSTEPYGALLSPREQSAQEYLQNASNLLQAAQLQSRALDDTALQTEFYETPMNFVDPKEYNFPGVVRKNRYKTILPNTHSRVCLKATDQEEEFLSTYINANYMRGYGGQEKAYIATQGPTVNTVSDFWRMVWQERSPIIVMITNIEEKNEKCTEYWPEHTVIHEGIEITVNQVIQADDYSLRIFSLKCEGEERSLRQYWYTSWPDQKTPDKAPPLLELVQEVEEVRQRALPGSGPVIVHCSAGIGRTGCFIATTLLCMQLRNEGVVDILKTTCQLRLDRGGMIQTAEQYQFVHHVLSLYEKQLSCPSEE
ncbi:hypothetical protein AAFF_G00282890 [Aldrovandia affinis]|uniref:protein-tyrosine-phosphatase n=1 Tax=Aldrovandia affinis TaxID=143900 RepID=A0AAD7T9W9_9TELE|nr:hypothetical protein AAFF_G00282890 [Aldrovandia affinis]